MESGLTPREIQQRIRAGQSLDEVTEVAGMPREKVERFALSVYDERRHLSDQARTHSVRRAGEAGSHRTLGAVADAWFTAREIDPDTVDWDATRGDDRHFWTITATWRPEENTERVATFGYDVRGAFSVAEDDLAEELIGAGADPVSDDEDAADPEADNEPTLNYADQFAIVNAIQADPAEDDAPEQAQELAVEATVEAAEQSGPFDLHDIVPTPESELDALYAMLRGHQEDSVNIYAGLAESQPAPKQRRRRRDRRQQNPESTDEVPAPPTDPETSIPAIDPEVSASTAPDEPEAAPDTLTVVEAEPSAPSAPDSSPAPDVASPVVASPEQPSLIEGDDPAPAEPAPKKRRKRAAVPSWDEIMFGGPDKL